MKYKEDIKISGLTKADRILALLLPFIDKNFHYEHCSNDDQTYFWKKPVATVQFNPETHVLITKQQMEINSQLKNLSAKIEDLSIMANTIESVNENQKIMTKKINELHSVQTGTLFREHTKPINPKARKKKEDDLYIQSLVNNSNSKIINNLQMLESVRVIQLKSKLSPIF